MSQSTRLQHARNRFANLGVAACGNGVVMPVSAVFLAGGGLATLTGDSGLALLFVLCAGLLGMMHRWTGLARDTSRETSGLSMVAVSDSHRRPQRAPIRPMPIRIRR